MCLLHRTSRGALYSVNRAAGNHEAGCNMDHIEPRRYRIRTVYALFRHAIRELCARYTPGSVSIQARTAGVSRSQDCIREVANVGNGSGRDRAPFSRQSNSTLQASLAAGGSIVLDRLFAYRLLHDCVGQLKYVHVVCIGRCSRKLRGISSQPWPLLL
jgi:hypothetical protein